MNKKNYVVRLLLGSLFFSIAVSSGAQTATEDNGGSIDELQVRPIRLPALQEVGGSPFMTADYQTGSVKLTDDKTVTKVPVKFNIFSNAIMVQKDGQDMRLESFKTVMYDALANNGSIKQVIFSQGYPEIDGHTGTSIYQVLSEGPKVQLLKFLSQKVEDAATLGDYSRREIVTTQQLYIYTPGGQMKKIKTSKQSVADALPASLSARIDEVVAANKLNLKNESDIAELIEVLNRP